MYALGHAPIVYKYFILRCYRFRTTLWVTNSMRRKANSPHRWAVMWKCMSGDTITISMYTNSFVQKIVFTETTQSRGWLSHPIKVYLKTYAYAGLCFTLFGCVMGLKWNQLVSYIDTSSVYFTWHRESGMLNSTELLISRISSKKT